MGKKQKSNRFYKMRSILIGLVLLTLTACGQPVDTGNTAKPPETVVTDSQTETNTDAAAYDTEPEVTEANQEAAQETESGLQPQSRAGALQSEGKEQTDELQVHYIDVGQGDATLVTCGDKSLLIDAGDNDKGTAIQLYLEKQGIASLEYVIGTHPDADHIGGMDVVITKFDCNTILLTEEEKDTATYRDVLSAMDYRGYQKTTPVVGQEYELGSASFTIVAPAELTSDSNDNSVAILLKHGDNKFYFEGDAGEKEEADILASGMDVSANVYKIGHHGSKTSTSDGMLQAVSPAYAIISVGDNSYGHPNAEVLNKLRAKGVQVFRTDEQGSVVATSDGIGVTWNASSSETWKAGEPASSGDTKEEAAEDLSSDVYGAAAADTGAEDKTSSQGSTDGSSPSSGETQNTADTNNVETTVHITETGEKYHSAGCQYLRKSDITVSLSDAKAKGLSPCSKCHPPQ